MTDPLAEARPPRHAAAQVVGVIAGVLSGWWIWPRAYRWAFPTDSATWWSYHTFSAVLDLAWAATLTFLAAAGAALVVYGLGRLVEAIIPDLRAGWRRGWNR